MYTRIEQTKSIFACVCIYTDKSEKNVAFSFYADCAREDRRIARSKRFSNNKIKVDDELNSIRRIIGKNFVGNKTINTKIKCRRTYICARMRDVFHVKLRKLLLKTCQ